MHIIGAGRVGGALSDAAKAAGQPCTLTRRGDDLSALEDGEDPILVCTRNDDLDSVLTAVPEDRHDDLVFIQNGMLRPWLVANELSHNTRGLLFFAVPSRGASIETGPASPFSGRHAASVVAFLRTLDVPAEYVHKEGFVDLEHEKLLWNTAFGLLCQAFSCTVGEVLAEHAGDLRSLVFELDRVGRRELAATVPRELLLRNLCSYSATIPDYQGSVKEWAWRNGWYVKVAAEHGLEMPVHTALCEQAGVSAQT